jgi:transcriptional regulator with XRE-family HTH domain
MGVTIYAVNHWETGRHAPEMHRIPKLSEIFGLNEDVERWFKPKSPSSSANAATRASGSLGEQAFGINEIRIELLREQVNRESSAAREFVHYSLLNLSNVYRDRPQNKRGIPFELENDNFVARLMSGEVRFLRVDVFFTKQRLARALFSLRDLPEESHRCRFLIRPPKSIPSINFRSVDNRVFFLGGYQHKRKSNFKEHVLRIETCEPLGSFLRQYWDELWDSAEELWDGDIETADRVRKSVGMADAEWDALKRFLSDTSRTADDLFDEIPSFRNDPMLLETIFKFATPAA